MKLSVITHKHEDRVAAKHLQTSYNFLRPACAAQKQSLKHECYHLKNMIDSRFCTIGNDCNAVKCCFPVEFDDVISHRTFSADIVYNKEKNSFTLTLENWHMEIGMKAFGSWGDVLTHEISDNVKVIVVRLHNLIVYYYIQIQYVFQKITSVESDNTVYSVWFTVVFSHKLEVSEHVLLVTM